MPILVNASWSSRLGRIHCHGYFIVSHDNLRLRICFSLHWEIYPLIPVPWLDVTEYMAGIAYAANSNNIKNSRDPG